MKTVSVLLLLFGSAPRGEVIELTGDHCVYCQNMEPIVHRMQREGLPIRQINVERQPDEARKYGYEGLPSFLVVVEGKVVNRQMGAMPESELRRLVAMIPADAPASVKPISPKPSSPNLRIELGEPTALPRPTENSGVVAEVKTAAVEEPESSVFPKLFRRSPKPEPAVRGQSQPIATGERTGDSALAASVRVNLFDTKGALQGSGTIIESRIGKTLVLTAGKPFSQMSAAAKIEVEVSSSAGAMAAGESPTKKFVAKLLKADFDSDVALIEFPTDQPLPKAVIAPAGRSPQLNDRVACIGGDRTKGMSRSQDRVTALNKYEGPDNIECSGVPAPGRCGGGLFNSADELVGVCINFSEDPRTKAPVGGMYCGLKPIHELLRSLNLGSLFESPSAAPSQLNEFVATAESNPGKPRPMPSEIQPAVKVEPAMSDFANDILGKTQPVAGVDSAMGDAAGDDDQEVIVIIRSKKSSAPTKVIHIHKASPKLRAILEGPTASPTPALTNTATAPRSTTSNNRKLGPPPLAVN